MKFLTKLIIVVLLALLLIGILGWHAQLKHPQHQELKSEKIKIENMPQCLQVYFYIEKYAKKYHIPPHIAYGIAYKESRYLGPFQWDYVSSVESSTGEGPMQIQFASAKLMGYHVSKQELRTNTDLNVKISMEIMTMLYKKYNNWELTSGHYNSGHPIINSYALTVAHFKPSDKFITYGH